MKLLFPTWDSMKKHQQVIQFACGLRDDPYPLLEIVYQQIVQVEMESKVQTVTEVTQFDIFSASELSSSAQLVWGREFNNPKRSGFIQKLWTQFTKPVNMEPLNNRFINYVTPDTKTVFIPSNFYLLCDVGNCEVLGHDSSEVFPAECALGINSGDLTNSLKLLQCIQKHQHTTLNNLCLVDVNMKDGDDTHLFDGLKLSKKIRFVRIVHCALIPSFYTHLIQELSHCNEVQHIDFSRTEGTPKALGKILSTMSALSYLDLTESNMSPEVSQMVLSALPCCSQLVQLHLSGNRLTNCVENLCRERANITFPCLENLQLDNTELNTEDVNNLATITQGSRLKVLNISNNCVTNCLAQLLSNGHQNLEHIQMIRCHLSEADIRSVSSAVDEGRLPKLRILDLTENSLTRCIGNLMGDGGHVGFVSLEELLLKETELSSADMESLAHAASVGKLPRLQVLNLSGNNLANCIGYLLGNADSSSFLVLNQLELDDTKLKGDDVC